MAELTTDVVSFEVAGRVATVTLTRPEAMNALDPETISSLTDCWLEIRDNPEIWAAVVTGEGDRAFCAGADLKKTIPARPGATDANWPIFQPSARHAIDNGMQIWKPIVAAVNGYCLGAGLTLLSMCDIRIAAEHAEFGLPEVRRGIVPTLGATQRLTRQLPWSVAMELLLLGDHISARRAIKEAAVRGLSLPIDEGIRLEELLSAHVRRTEDFKEGPKAFAEKRDPAYRGN